VLLFTYAYLVFLAERVYPINCDYMSGKFSSYLNALWLIIVTIFTVGYGDIVPQTDIGRAIAILAALSGLIFSATLIGLVH
jgi:voltage-gated potassium channel